MATSNNQIDLITPYGGKLIDLLVPSWKRPESLAHAADLPSLQLSPRSLQDLELLATGAFSPLTTYMSQKDYESVVETMRLSSGVLFPIPITLPVSDIRNLMQKKDITLRNQHNEIMAIMSLEEIYKKNLEKEAKYVFGTMDTTHPMVSEVSSWGEYYISGRIQVINLPRYHDFRHLRHDPRSLRSLLIERGNPNVVAFQTRNPIHRAHEELCKRAAERVNGTLLIHPTVGITKIDDIDFITRVRIYDIMYRKYFDNAKTVLSIIPLAMRFAGPREAVWHAIIRRNYGANYFIVGRNHASPGVNSQGKQFYPPDAAQELIQKLTNEIEIKPLLFKELVYDRSRKIYVEINANTHKMKSSVISGTDARNVYLSGHKKLPKWFTRPEVADILADSYVPIHKKGFCVWLTGLPCAGKSTIASILHVMIRESGREVSVLDGDVIRTHLSKGLGYTKLDRDTNILRIGFVASEIVRHNGAVICAAISPYENTRRQVRHLMPKGFFILVFVDTPLAVCEERDNKGFYKKARSKKMLHFTGVSDSYEQPMSPELHLSTVEQSPEQCADAIFNYLKKIRFIK